MISLDGSQLPNNNEQPNLSALAILGGALTSETEKLIDAHNKSIKSGRSILTKQTITSDYIQSLIDLLRGYKNCTILTSSLFKKRKKYENGSFISKKDKRTEANAFKILPSDFEYNLCIKALKKIQPENSKKGTHDDLRVLRGSKSFRNHVSKLLFCSWKTSK